jgi:putative membrane protein
MYKFSQIALVTVFSTVGLLAADLPAAHDQTFVNKAAQGGQAEVTLGQLAAQKASNQKVKDFGQRMVTDHGKAGQQLTSIAQKKSITPPSSMTSEDQALYKKLQGLSGSEFDKTYMQAMVKDHQKDIDEFQREADSGKDSDVKAFASQTLPTLREHLQMAKDAAAAVGASQQ